MTDNEKYLSSDDEIYENAFGEECYKEPCLREFENLKLDGQGNNKTDNKKKSDIENGEEKDEEKENDEKFVECEDNVTTDEDSQRDYEKTLSTEELLANKVKAEELKKVGNDQFKQEQYTEAIETYTNALKLCPLSYPNERSVLFGNRAATHIQMNTKSVAIEDCSNALKLNPNYIKVLLRRARLYEESDKLDESLVDFNKIVELDPSCTEARLALTRLPPKIEARNEKMKEEMLGKLKDLGNMILKPFGLSTNNFQMQQDPVTGSYSVNFKQ